MGGRGVAFLCTILPVCSAWPPGVFHVAGGAPQNCSVSDPLFHPSSPYQSNLATLVALVAGLAQQAGQESFIDPRMYDCFFSMQHLSQLHDARQHGPDHCLSESAEAVERLLACSAALMGGMVVASGLVSRIQTHLQADQVVTMSFHAGSV